MSKADLKGTDYIRPLTGIRAIAAYMVFMMHYNPFEKGSFVHSFFSQSYTGVSIFFVLSGFLITYRYYGSYEMNGRWFLKYFQNRVARIYPLYFLITTATFLVLLISGLNRESTFTTRQIVTNDVWVYFTNITFIRGFFEQLVFTMIPPGWSLTVEEVFYLSAPLIWLISLRLKLLGQACILLLIGFALVLLGRHIHFYGFFATDIFMLKFTFFGRCIQFFAGVWLAMIILKRSGAGSLRSAKGEEGDARPRKGINKTYSGLALVFLCILGMTFSWINGHDYLTIIIDNVFLAGAVALLFWGLITEKTKLSAFLSLSLMDLLGRSSYAFYLIHVGIIQQFLNNFVSTNILIQFVLLNLVSIALYKWVENPLMLSIKAKKW